MIQPPTFVIKEIESVITSEPNQSATEYTRKMKEKRIKKRNEQKRKQKKMPRAQE